MKDLWKCWNGPQVKSKIIRNSFLSAEFSATPVWKEDIGSKSVNLLISLSQLTSNYWSQNLWALNKYLTIWMNLSWFLRMPRNNSVLKRSLKRWRTIGLPLKFNSKNGEIPEHLLLLVLQSIRCNKFLMIRSSKPKLWKVVHMPKFSNKRSKIGKSGFFILSTSHNIGSKCSPFGCISNLFSLLLISKSIYPLKQLTSATLICNGKQWWPKLLKILRL